MSRFAFLCTCLLLVSYRADECTAEIPGDVQAILDRNCIKCHGPLEQNAGLRLDSVGGILRGTTEGPVVEMGKPESSKLIRVLTPGADPHMPPKKQLEASDISILRSWILAAEKIPAAASQAAKQSVPSDPT